ncbi:MAG: hypothetical protein K9H64_07625 [Bacteroidales bacterium]|nr:hypothetical protein [Bacteroidales bacterium]MCF8455589.1 hypothetical protein [Bacteroidales bacterium]
MNKTLFFFTGIAILMLVSCNNKADKPSADESLAKTNQTVIYEVSLELDPEAPNWMGNIDQKKLVTKLFSQVENGELDAYGFLDDPQKETIDWQDVLLTMDAINDTMTILDVETGVTETKIIQNELRLNEIKALIFIEEWSLDGDGKISKEVLGIAPVRYIFDTPDDAPYHDTLVSKVRKRIPFVAYYGNKKPVLVENY